MREITRAQNRGRSDVRASAGHGTIRNTFSLACRAISRAVLNIYKGCPSTGPGRPGIFISKLQTCRGQIGERRYYKWNIKFLSPFGLFAAHLSWLSNANVNVPFDFWQTINSSFFFLSLVLFFPVPLKLLAAVSILLQKQSQRTYINSSARSTRWRRMKRTTVLIASSDARPSVTDSADFSFYQPWFRSSIVES